MVCRISPAPHFQLLFSILQWISGHCQIAGNEAADSLAKKGARILQTHSNDLSYHSLSVKLYIRQFF